ncbi:MAG TPA: PKD domain-containing protein, partial [Bacteroidia bacterium]|nr:PKD domain-containing protein [Bacteroidia bacterium]
VTSAYVSSIDSSLIPKNYVYYIPSTTTTTTTSVTVYNVQFNSSYANGTPQTYNWSFGDGSTSTLANPMHAYSQLAFYDVCLSVTGTNSCVSSICDTVNLSSPTAYSCYATISSSVIPSSNSVSFSTTATGTAPFNYNWNFGDSTTYDSTNNTAYHSYANAGTYIVTLRVTDANNKVAIAKYNVTTALAPVSCITNYSVTSIQAVTTATPTTVITNTSELGDVIVTWTDASGNVYTSKNIAQPAGSSFQVLSTDNYQNNMNGQRTKKLHVKFSCWLYNSTHPPIQITNADAVIAIAYK